MTQNQTTITSAFACTLCGCVCDDLRISVSAGRIQEAAGACGLAEPALLGQTAVTSPPAQIDGVDVTLEEAVERAAQILRRARAPLIFGLTQCGTEGVRAALELAEKIGADIDTSAAALPLTLAVQETGMSTCSLGEVRQRADLVIFWGADPVVNQPRLLERVVLAAAPHPVEENRFVMDRSRRTVVVVDAQRTATAALADHFIAVVPGHQFEMLWALRGLLHDPPESDGDGMSELARLMKSCRYGVVFFGPGLSSEGPRTVEALLRLVADLNDRTRFYAQGLLDEAAGGADNVLAWQTGYPCSVNFAHGYPRSNPGEFSADKLLENNEVDACLLVGPLLRRLSSVAVAEFARLPTIVLGGPAALPSPAVRITTSIPGIHTSGIAYRMDGVPIPLRPVLPATYPHPAVVLQSIAERIGHRVASGSRCRSVPVE